MAVRAEEPSQKRPRAPAHLVRELVPRGRRETLAEQLELEPASDRLALGHQHLLACERRDADFVPRWRSLRCERPPESVSTVARHRTARRVRRRCAPENRRLDRASTAGVRATAPTRLPRAGTVTRTDHTARLLPRPPPAVRTTDARGNAPHGDQYRGSSAALLYNTVRLHSAISYVAPADKLAGREQEIWAERERKLAEAEARRRSARAEASDAVRP